MKKLVIVGMLFIMFLGCSRNKIINMSNNSEPMKLSRNKGLFDAYYKEILENKKIIQDEMEMKQEKYLNEKYHFEEEEGSWKAKNSAVEKIIALDNYIAPAVSFNDEFILCYERPDIRNKKNYYDLKLLHQPTNNVVEIMKADESQFNDYYKKVTPTFSWNRLGESFAFTSIYKRVSNVFLCFVRYNEYSLEVEYSIFQITNNKDRSVFFVDPQFSDDGEYLSYSKIDENGKSSIYLFNLLEHKETLFGSEEEDLRGFRFGKYDREMGAFVQKKGVVYQVYYVKNFTKKLTESRKKLIKTEMNDIPTIYPSFAEYAEKIAVVNMMKGVPELVIHDYDKKTNLSTKFDMKKKVRLEKEFFPKNSPFWLFDDNLILFCNDNMIFYATTTESNLKKEKLSIVKLIGGVHINSISKDFDDKIYFSKFVKQVAEVVSTHLDIEYKPVGNEAKMVYYKYEIIEYDEENQTALLERKGRKISASMMKHKKADAIWENERELLTVDDDSEDKFVAGSTIIVKYRKEIKRLKKINSKIRFDKLGIVISTVSDE